MKRDRWIDHENFASFSAVFPPYQNDGVVVMKDYAPEWNSGMKRILLLIGFELRLGNERK